MIAILNHVPITTAFPADYAKDTNWSYEWDVPSFSGNKDASAIIAVSDASGKYSATSKEVPIANSGKCTALDDKALDFVWDSAPSGSPDSCDLWKITFNRITGGDGPKAPITLSFLPVQDAPISFQTNSLTEYDWTVPFQPGTKFTLAVSDAGKHGSGGTGLLYTVGNKPKKCSDNKNAGAITAGLAGATSTATARSSNGSPKSSPKAGGSGSSSTPKSGAGGTSANAASSSANGGGGKTGAAVGGAIGGIAALVLIGVGVWWYRKRLAQNGAGGQNGFYRGASHAGAGPFGGFAAAGGMGAGAAMGAGAFGRRGQSAVTDDDFGNLKASRYGSTQYGNASNNGANGGGYPVPFAQQQPAQSVGSRGTFASSDDFHDHHSAPLPADAAAVALHHRGPSAHHTHSSSGAHSNISQERMMSDGGNGAGSSIGHHSSSAVGTGTGTGTGSGSVGRASSLSAHRHTPSGSLGGGKAAANMMAAPPGAVQRSIYSTVPDDHLFPPPRPTPQQQAQQEYDQQQAANTRNLLAAVQSQQQQSQPMTTAQLARSAAPSAQYVPSPPFAPQRMVGGVNGGPPLGQGQGPVPIAVGPQNVMMSGPASAGMGYSSPYGPGSASRFAGPPAGYQIGEQQQMQMQQQQQHRQQPSNGGGSFGPGRFLDPIRDEPDRSDSRLQQNRQHMSMASEFDEGEVIDLRASDGGPPPYQPSSRDAPSHPLQSKSPAMNAGSPPMPPQHSFQQARPDQYGSPREIQGLAGNLRIANMASPPSNGNRIQPPQQQQQYQRAPPTALQPGTQASIYARTQQMHDTHGGGAGNYRQSTATDSSEEGGLAYLDD